MALEVSICGMEIAAASGEVTAEVISLLLSGLMRGSVEFYDASVATKGNSDHE
jgi:hypothetical protein